MAGTNTYYRASVGSTTVPIGIGQLAISDDPFEVLVTYSLGSCVGLTLYDPQLKIGGMLHSQLPLSKMDPDGAKRNPHRYTDTAVADLLQQLYDRGARRDRLIAKAAGGSSILDRNGHFRIGERNQAVLRKILWKNNIVLAAEDLGGEEPRSLYLHIDKGCTLVRGTHAMRELT